MPSGVPASGAARSVSTSSLESVFGSVLQGRGATRCAQGLASIHPSLWAKVKKLLTATSQRATDRGGNAVVGVDIDYEVIGVNNGMLLVSASGTAVVAEGY